MAEALLRTRADERGFPLQVSSAGLMFDDRPATPEAVKVLADIGVELADHASRIISPEIVAAADLMIGMERRHVREAVVLVPESFRHSFTLKELARITIDQPAIHGETYDEWLQRVGYVPDSFGHPAQFPQLLAGFGLDQILELSTQPRIPRFQLIQITQAVRVDVAQQLEFSSQSVDLLFSRRTGLRGHRSVRDSNRTFLHVAWGSCLGQSFRIGLKFSE